MAADDEKWQVARDRVNDFAERLHLPPVFWEPPIDYRQNTYAAASDIPPLAEERPRARYLHGLSIAFSLVLHGAVLGYAASYVFLAEPQAGAPVENTAAINVELTDSAVLEAIRPADATTAAPASTAMPLGRDRPPSPQPDTLKSDDQSRAEADVSPMTPPPPPQQVDAASATQQPEAAPPETTPPSQTSGENVPPVLTVQQPSAEPILQPGPAVATVAGPSAPSPETQPPPSAAAAEPTVRPSPRTRRENRRRAAALAQGAATATEAAGSDEQSHSRSGRASASRGQVSAYRNSVQAHLAANKPAGGQGAGTVRVAFVLSPSGGLISAHIARSSGNRALDQAALGAVHDAAPFPEPPAGTGASQLRFNFPFYFR